MKFRFKALGLGILGSLILTSQSVAQFIFPPASIFSPTASLSRGAKTDPIEWLKNHDAGMLAFLLSVNDLDTQLEENKEALTIFVPTNKAFNKLSTDELKKLAKRNNIERLLKYHLVSGIISEQDIQKQEIATVEGSSVKITGKQRSNGTIEAQLNGAKVESTVGINDKLMFVIVDEVLLPPDF